MRLIGLSEQVMGCVVAFIDACRNGLLLSRVDDFRAYNMADDGVRNIRNR